MRAFDGVQIEGLSAIFDGLGVAGDGLVVHTAIGRQPDPRIAIGMATTAAVRGASTVILDADLERRGLARSLGLDPAPGLSEYLAREAEARDVLQVVELSGDSVRGHRRVVCVSAGARPASGTDPDELGQVEHVLGRLRSAYDIAVVLAPALDHPLGGWLADRADAVLAEVDRRGLGRPGRARMAEAAARLEGRRAGLAVVVGAD